MFIHEQVGGISHHQLGGLANCLTGCAERPDWREFKGPFTIFD
jgi:hypothetical protein